MKFCNPLALLCLAAAASALPSGNLAQSDLSQVLFPVPNDITVEQGSNKCGDQAELSCCNKVEHAGDTTKIADGLAAGLLSGLLGSGSGSKGAGLFSQCSKLNIKVLIPPSDILNQQCKQNIVCCAKSGHSASHDLIGATLPCIALGSLL